MEQQLQLAKSRTLFGSENKEGQVRQKPPVSLPGAKFQSLASPCIQEHVPVIQNPPTHACRDSGGEENIEKGFAGQGRKLQPLQNGNIWNLEGRKTSVLYHCHLKRFLNLGNLGIQVLKKFLLLYLYVGQDLFLPSPTLLDRTINSVEF